MSRAPELTKQSISAKETTNELEIYHNPKWVRVLFAGEFIADSRNALLLLQRRRPPVYYFPYQDVRSEFLEDGGRSGMFPVVGKANLLTVRVGDRVAENAAWKVTETYPETDELDGYIAFKWGAMDSWFEEDEEIFVHPRDPYIRVDTLPSSRHIRVELNGETIAETRRAVLLFETGLPTRYYIPLTDVRMDLLKSSQTQTQCPYKGLASYYSVETDGESVRDAAWYYRFPLAEVGPIQNMLAFYPQKVDAIYVDGERQS